MTTVQMTTEVFRELVSYLAKRPYHEVSGLIQGLEPAIRSIATPVSSPAPTAEDTHTKNNKNSKK